MVDEWVVIHAISCMMRWRPLNGRPGLRMAVWLQAEVCERRLRLRPRLYAASVCHAQCCYSCSIRIGALHKRKAFAVFCAKTSYLEKNVVDWRLDLETQRVAGVFLVQNELVVDAEERHRWNRGVILSGDLVTIALHVQPFTQLFQLLSKVPTSRSPHATERPVLRWNNTVAVHRESDNHNEE